MCVRVLPHSSLSRLVQSVCDCAWVSVWASVCARAADPRALTGIRATFKKRWERRFCFNVCVVLPSLCFILSYTFMTANVSVLLVIMINEWISSTNKDCDNVIQYRFTRITHSTSCSFSTATSQVVGLGCYTIPRLTFFVCSQQGNPIHFANRFQFV